MAIVLSSLLATSPALAVCSTDALDAVHAELRAPGGPTCGSRRVRRAFNRARIKMASVAVRATRECAKGEVPRVGSAHIALVRALAKMAGAGADSTCAASYQAELERFEAELTAAATGVSTTTTTTPPGTPSTTLPPTCPTVTLDLDKGDCTRVTSDPPGLVTCGANCDLQTFTVPADRPLRLKGTPAQGSTGVIFGLDCLDDGTVPLDSASPPDCSLSCDCTSGP